MNSKLLGNPFLISLPFLSPDEGGGGAPVGGAPGKAASGAEDFYGADASGDDAGGDNEPVAKKGKLDTEAGTSSVIDGSDDEDGDKGEAADSVEGEDGEGDGEGGDEDFGDLKEFLDEDGEDDKDAGEDKKDKKAVKAEPAVLKIDPESLKQLRDSVTPAGKQDAGEQLTPQQLRALLNPVEVTEDMLKSLGFEAPTPEQVKGFQQFSNAIVKNAYSLTKVMLQKKEEELMGLIQPLLGGYQQAQQSQTKQAFFAKYPSLTKYERLVKAAAQEVSATNADGSPKSQDQIFKEVAAATVATMRDLGISFKSTASPGADGRSAVPPPNKQSPSGRSGGVGKAGGKTNDADGDIYARGR